MACPHPEQRLSAELLFDRVRLGEAFRMLRFPIRDS